VEADVLDRQALEQVFAGCDAIVHMAAITSSVGRPNDSFRVSVAGTHAVAATAREAGIKTLIYVGTQAANEGIYATTKWKAEAAIKAAGIKPIVLRPSLVYGPGDQGLFARIVEFVRDGPLLARARGASVPYGSGGWRVTVLICARNEVQNLPHVLPLIPDFVDEVLLVDGHSTDGTVEVARQIRPGIRILQQPGTGKGQALRYGVEHATSDIIVTLDADGETDPLELPRFLDALFAGADWIKGSRFRDGYHRKPLKRIFGNWVIVNTCNLLFGTRFTDVCCGYNAFWRRVPRELDLWAADGWNYEPLLVARLLRAGRDVRELGYRYRGRLSGDSKLPDWRQGLRAVWVLVRERFRRRAV